MLAVVVVVVKGGVLQTTKAQSQSWIIPLLIGDYVLPSISLCRAFATLTDLLLLDYFFRQLPPVPPWPMNVVEHP